MPTVRRSILTIAAACLACAALVGSARDARAQAAGDLAIVVHPQTPVDTLSFSDLRQVFLGERQYWTKDLPVVLLVRGPTGAERDAVLNVIYQMKDAQFKQYWIAKVFRAETASSPKIVATSGLAAQLVASIPGAVTFMMEKDVKPGAMKVLKIDGRLPGENGYKLHLTRK
jgi:ABC-type phosphate transport system substrate-binding protein